MIKSLQFEWLTPEQYQGLREHACSLFQACDEFSKSVDKISGQCIEQSVCTVYEKEEYELPEGLKFAFREESIPPMREGSHPFFYATIHPGKNYLSVCQNLLQVLRKSEIENIAYCELHDSELGSHFAARCIGTKPMPLSAFECLIGMAEEMESVANSVTDIQENKVRILLAVLKHRLRKN